MATVRSFTDYVSERFYNDLYSAASDYLQRNYRSMDWPDEIVRCVYSVELSEIYVKYVFVDDLPDMRIAFDVLIECEIEFGEKNYRNDRYDQCSKWLKASCCGDLSCSLDDFSIMTIAPYEYKDKQDNPLSDQLVPYLKKDDLDKVARDFLSRYYPEALETPQAIEPQRLVVQGFDLEAGG